jgi:DNA polymerase III subunit beta
MKIQTTRDEILNKILFINRAMSPKVSNFILSGIMMEANKDTLNIYGTDLETSISSSFKVKVENAGRVVVPSKILINVLRSFPEAKLDLELLSETNELSLTCQKANFKLNTFALEEYPQFPEVKTQNSFKIDFKVLKNLISKVQKACSTDESRVVLTGILVDIGKDYINLAATDSYRLSVAGGEVSYKGEPVKVVVPERVLDTISKSDINDGNFEINIEENQISFVISESSEKKEFKTTVVSRLLSGKFPDYEKLVPQEFKHSIIMDRNKILEVIKRVASISQDNVPIRLDFEKGKLVVSMNIRETGSSVEDLEIGYGEETIQIAFNPEFLIEGLNIMDEEKIIFNIVEPLKPVKMIPDKNKNRFYLLMPIRIS